MDSGFAFIINTIRSDVLKMSLDEFFVVQEFHSFFFHAYIFFLDFFHPSLFLKFLYQIYKKIVNLEYLIKL